MTLFFASLQQTVKKGPEGFVSISHIIRIGVDNRLIEVLVGAVIEIVPYEVLAHHAQFATVDRIRKVPDPVKLDARLLGNLYLIKLGRRRVTSLESHVSIGDGRHFWGVLQIQNSLD